jgi:hypothetical protein
MTQGQCIEDGCDRPAVKRDRCDRDYLKWYRSTPPAERSPRPRLGLTDLERFYTHVNKMGPVAKNRPDLGRCHLWTGGATKGYGIFWADGTSHRAHVWIYKQKRGAIPDGLPLDHFACDRTLCVNELHTRPTSQRENVLRSGGGGALNAEKMECPDGHDYDEVNTRVNAKGSRECLICKRRDQREIKQAQRALARGYVPLAAGSATCPHGHDLAGHGSRKYHGQLVCLTCTAPTGRGGRRPLPGNQLRR